MSQNHFAAKAVNGLLPKILEPVLKKRGFPAVALLTNWEAIVGPELAALSRPERLSWPRQSQEAALEALYEEPGYGDGWAAARRQGSTLRLRVDPAAALEVEYQKSQILDRINTYFGYRAVTSLRLVQGPVTDPFASQASSQPVAAPRHAPVKGVDFDAIEDSKLRAALEKLNVSRRKR